MSRRHENSRCPIGHTCADIDNCIRILELLRSENTSLRNWGSDEANEVDNLKDEVASLEKEVDSLRSEAADA